MPVDLNEVPQTVRPCGGRARRLRRCRRRRRRRRLRADDSRLFSQDDFGVVGLLSQKPWSYFPRWFVAPWTENVYGYVPDEIRPFPALSYQIAAAFGAASPVPNHILNIAIHALNGLLVMWIRAGAAGIALVPAMFAGLVFVLLPIQAESVAWVTGRVDSLPTCFLLRLVSVRPFVSEARKPTRPVGTELRRAGRHISGRPALFFAALFSKQNTITLRQRSSCSTSSSHRRRLELSVEMAPPVRAVLLLTVGFLLLRYVLFHEVARESVLSAQRYREFVSDTVHDTCAALCSAGQGFALGRARHIIVCLASIALRSLRRVRAGQSVRKLWRPAIYFGVIWIAFGMAPILYLVTTRHATCISRRLAGRDARHRARHTVARSAVRYSRLGRALAAAALLVRLCRPVTDVVRDWNSRRRRSRTKALARSRA
jgi:hypothetical protein